MNTLNFTFVAQYTEYYALRSGVSINIRDKSAYKHQQLRLLLYFHIHVDACNEPNEYLTDITLSWLHSPAYRAVTV